MKLFRNLKTEAILILFVGVVLVFFYKSVFLGQIPFPGDLLIGEYTPYNSYPYHGYAPGAFPNKGQNFDVIRLIYPAKFFAIEALKTGSIPLWNPYIFAGSPHVASLQSGTFYPLNVLFFLFPFIFSWAAYIIIQPLLAAFFTFLFLRRLELSKLASFFGGIAFAFSSYFTVWLQYGNLNHSYLWLPFVLFLIVAIAKKPTIFTYFALSFVLSFTLLAGYIQNAMYVFIFAFVFFLYYFWVVEKKKDLKRIAVCALFFLIPFPLTAIQLIPTIELFLQSTRSAYTTDAFLQLLIPSYHFITFLVPDFFGNPATRNYFLTGTYIERVSYIGVIPALFAFYALVTRRRRLVWFFFLSSILTFLLVFDTFVSRSLYSLYIPPILSTGVPSRMMFLFCFSVSILAAFGFNTFQKSFQVKHIVITVGSFLVVFLLLWTGVLFGSGIVPNVSGESELSISLRNLIIPTVALFFGFIGIIAYFFVKKIRIIVLLCFILLTIAELFYFFQKITPFAPSDTMYPSTVVMQKLRTIQGIDRSWGYGSGYIPSNLQTMENIYGTDGYDALHIKRYAEFLSVSEYGKIEEPLERSEAQLASGFGQDALRVNTSRQKVMNLLGVKYVLHKTDGDTSTPDTRTFPSNIYSLVGYDTKWQIYENEQSIPRMYFVENIEVEKNRTKVANRLIHDDFDMQNTAIVEEEIPLSLTKDPNASIELLSYEPNKVVLKTSSDTDSFLVITDNYYNGWKGIIDGEAAKIYRTNYTFRGMVIPRGEHTVQFIYDPISFRIGSILTIVTVLVCAGVLIISVIREKRAKRT